MKKSDRRKLRRKKKREEKRKLRVFSKTSKHHILPRSRGGKSNLKNLTGLTIKDHQNYHTLFWNLTPDEIIVYLVEHCWNGQWNWVHEALECEEVT